MVTHHKVEGYQNFIKLLEELQDKGQIVVYFGGSVNEEGISWCPDCQKAEPVVQAILSENEHKTFHFVHVSVGPREEWKNPNCPFQTDPKLKLTSVPTLLLLGTSNRLNDEECQDEENIKMIFEDIP